MICPTAQGEIVDALGSFLTPKSPHQPGTRGGTQVVSRAFYPFVIGGKVFPPAVKPYLPY